MGNWGKHGAPDVGCLDDLEEFEEEGGFDSAGFEKLPSAKPHKRDYGLSGKNSVGKGPRSKCHVKYRGGDSAKDRYCVEERVIEQAGSGVVGVLCRNIIDQAPQVIAEEARGLIVELKELGFLHEFFSLYSFDDKMDGDLRILCSDVEKMKVELDSRGCEDLCRRVTGLQRKYLLAVETCADLKSRRGHFDHYLGQANRLYDDHGIPPNSDYVRTWLRSCVSAHERVDVFENAKALGANLSIGVFYVWGRALADVREARYFKSVFEQEHSKMEFGFVIAALNSSRFFEERKGVYNLLLVFVEEGLGEDDIGKFFNIWGRRVDSFDERNHLKALLEEINEFGIWNCIPQFEEELSRQ